MKLTVRQKAAELEGKELFNKERPNARTANDAVLVLMKQCSYKYESWEGYFWRLGIIKAFDDANEMK